MKSDADFVSLLKFKTRPFKAKFIPNKIFRDLDSRKNDYWALRMYFRKFRARLEIVQYEDITIGGEFDDVNEYVVLRIFGDYDNHAFDESEWFMFKFRLIQVMMHELIHWRQCDRRGHDRCKMHDYISKHPKAEYYSSADEVESFAHCIYLEIRREYPEIPISEAIETYGGETHDFIFNDVFENDFKNIALSKYVSEILRWDKRYKARQRINIK